MAKEIVNSTTVPNDSNSKNDGSNDSSHNAAHDASYVSGMQAAKKTKAFLADAGSALKQTAKNIYSEAEKANAEGKFDKAKQVASQAGTAVNNAYKSVVPQKSRDDIARSTQKAGKVVKGFINGLFSSHDSQ